MTLYTGLTGEGTQYFSGPGSFVAVTQVKTMQVTITSQKVRIIYNSDPKFVQYCGQIGIGNPDATPFRVVQYWGIHWQGTEDHFVAGTPFTTGFFWKLPPGVSLDLDIEN